MEIRKYGGMIKITGLERDPLPSWNDGPAKQAIFSFIDRVTDDGSVDFIPVPERIATFDNDGTLWVEQPLYTQGFFTLDEVRKLAPCHPEWWEQQPFKAVLEGDKATFAGITRKQIAEMLLAVLSGTGQDAFIGTARQWLSGARHPRFNVLYTSLVYWPMIELMDYLRANQFKVFIVSGGGVDFLRAFAEETYGVPPYNVVGSSLEYEYKLIDGVWQLSRVAKLGKYDDAEGKPESIALHIGRRPIFAAGNSDGDLAMMRYAASADRLFLNLLVHHDDAQREYAYDRESQVGRLREALDEAIASGWTVVSMKNDWGRIFADRE